MSQRKTVTLDEDVAERVDAAARATGKPLSAVVNDVLRREMKVPFDQGAGPNKPFVIETHHMGGLRPGLSLDCIAELLDQIEGPDRR